MSVEFSVGMAVYDSGLPFPESLRMVFTTMSLLVHHPLVKEVVWVDNNPLPESPLPKFAEKCGGRVHYVAMPTPQGTSPPRNRVFEEAKYPYVACLDPHCILYNGFFESVAEFYNEKGHDCPDLVHGPVITEAVRVMATHMNDQWRSEMWGTWSIAWKHPSGFLFSTITRDDKSLEYVTLDEVGEQRPLNGENYGLPKIHWNGHERHLYAAGCSHPEKPFVIPGHGMGFFACRKDAWLPFHEDCRGFGGEEMTTGARYRKAGRKVWCVPGAKWWHHFERLPSVAGGPVLAYRNVRWDRIRNYVLEFKRLGMSLAPIRAHFGPDKMAEGEWQQCAAGAPWPTQSTGVNPATLGQRPADVPEPTIMARAPQSVLAPPLIQSGGPIAALLQRQQRQQQSAVTPEGIPLIDATSMPVERLWTELVRKSKFAKRLLVVTYLIQDAEVSGGRPGVLPAVREFVKHHKRWTTISRTNKDGRATLVLSCDDRDKTAPPNVIFKAMNFAKAVIKHRRTDYTHAPDEVFDKRVEICLTCEHRYHDYCGLCGCPIEVKAAWSQEQCPDDPPRWGAVELPMVTESSK